MTANNLMPGFRSRGAAAKTGLFAACILATATGLGAQTVGLRLVGADIRNPIAGSLGGGGVQVGFPISSKGLQLRIGAEWLAGSHDRVGLACAGLVANTCPIEPLEEDASTKALLVGLGGVVLGGRAVSLGVTADLGLSRITGTTVGVNTGHRLAASETLWRGEVGLETLWRPAAGRMGVGGGASMGVQTPTRQVREVDGYQPFEGRNRITRLWFGVVWSWRGPPNP